MNLSRFVVAVATSLVASFGARALRTPGMPFDTFGRWTGMRLAARGYKQSASLLVRPVSIARYFEFPFALSCLRGLGFRRCLDVSSPYLFSLFLRSKGIVDHVCMINPDPYDIAFTADIVSRLQVKRFTTKQATIEELDESDSYDAIWSISVVEHIAGEMGDSEAVAKMFSLLGPSGRLILTFPVGRDYTIQKRAEDLYSAGHPVSEDGLRFFQRVYDAGSIQERMVNAVGRRPTACRWFGEKRSGTYMAYEKRWIRDGLRVTATDSWRIARDYEEYERWEDMPGIGVCGLAFDKTKE
jgi:hypothetical protein